MKNWKMGYSIPTIVFIMAFASFSLTLSIVWVTFYLKRTHRNVNYYAKWESYYKILDQAMSDFGIGVGDEPTLPNSGWYSELPENIDDYELRYEVEDSKIDINHIELKKFFIVKAEESGGSGGMFGGFSPGGKNFIGQPPSEPDKANEVKGENTLEMNEQEKQDFGKALDAAQDKSKSTQWMSDEEREEMELSDDIVLNAEKFEDYLYYPEDFEEYLKYDNYETVEPFVSIYNIPNLNTSSPEGIERYLKSLNVDKSFIKEFSEKIKNYRKNRDYLKHRYRAGNNLLIGENEYNGLKSFNWDDADDLYVYFDYTGRINLNFVDESVFKLIVKACGKKDDDPGKYWKKIEALKEKNKDIRDIEISNIFGNDFLFYEKIISKDNFSKLFKIEIEKDEKLLEAIVRRYKTREIKTKILKVKVVDLEEERRRREREEGSYDDESDDIDVDDELDDEFDMDMDDEDLNIEI